MQHTRLFVHGGVVRCVVLGQVFNCRDVNGVWYLVADMRQECYTGEWVAIAAYALVMIAVYVVGLPLAVLVILYRNRTHLFGDPALDDQAKLVQDKYGFLYRCGVGVVGVRDCGDFLGAFGAQVVCAVPSV